MVSVHTVNCPMKTNLGQKIVLAMAFVRQAVRSIRELKSCLTGRDPVLMLQGLDPACIHVTGVVLIAAAFFGSLAIASLLLRPTYDLIEAMKGLSATPVPILSWLGNHLADERAYRIFSYLRLLPVLALVLVLRSWRVAWCFNASLIHLDRAKAMAGIRCFVFGVLVFAALASVQVAVGAVHRVPGVGFSDWAGGLAMAVVLGLVKGAGTEIIYRGFVLAALCSAARRGWIALILSAVFFAYAYSKGAIDAHPDVTWQTGWSFSYIILAGIVIDAHPLTFVNYFLMGLILGLLTMTSRSLWPAVGLHAALLTVRHTFQKGFGLGSEGLHIAWGGPQILDGWLVIPALLLLGLMMLGAGDVLRILNGSVGRGSEPHPRPKPAKATGSGN